MKMIPNIWLLSCVILAAAPALADNACSEKAASPAQLRAASTVMPAKPAQLRVVAPGGAAMGGAEVTALRNDLRAATANCLMAQRAETQRPARPTAIASGLLDDLY